VSRPNIGTGRGALDPAIVMRATLDTALRALERSHALHHVMFVVRDEDQALHFSEAMDALLGRAKAQLPQGAVFQAVRCWSAIHKCWR
jgi:O-acetyl-ADP-ribose deacetylase (regulator of RNase III)